MHHTLFDSYDQAIDKAKNFILEIVLVDGTVVAGSHMPIPAMSQVLLDVDACMTKQEPITIWDKHKKVLTIVPPSHIKLIRVELKD